MKKLALLASAAALMALTTPAQAADVIFNGNSSTDGSNTTDRAFSSGGINGEATAWTVSNNQVNNAYLGLYGGGLGVTNDAEGNGSSSSSHTVDNYNGVDFILFRFDKAVNLSELNFTSFGDTDVSIRYGNLAGAYTTSPSWDNNTAWSTVTSALPGTFNSYGGDDNGWRNIGTPSNVYANTWIVSALFPANGANDYFKLKGIRVTTSAVPEPATWAMMILGFGVIGGAMRRRKGQANEGALRLA